MSPRKLSMERAPGIETDLHRVWVAIGLRIRDARLSRHWSVADVAARAGISRDLVYMLERGEPVSVEVLARLATALSLRLEIDLADVHRRASPAGSQKDLVHAAMGELEAGHFRRLGVPFGLDEPYQHFQFAGRADFVAWRLDLRALFHAENWTQFPDFQATAGSYNAKRIYLGAALASRLGIRGWVSETHVLIGLWSSEVLHSLRMQPESLRGLCPDPSQVFDSWWRGEPPTAGRASTLVVLDPFAAAKQRQFIGLEEALSATTRPRFHSYADAAAALRRAA